MTPDPPAWVRDAVFYQVFPDRFASSPRVAKPGVLEPWTAPPTLRGYKGGDLLGIVERLDDLTDLGISAIYLNPIFTAASNHRYNAYDFFAVDPLLGGDAALRELLDAAHDRDVRIVLDGVFNHVGRGFWPFHHVLEAGGASPYRDWFYLDEAVLEGQRAVRAYDDGQGGPKPADPGFRSWWDTRSLPKLRVEHPPVREYLLAVAEHWLRFGIDGWRLDVPEDIEDETFWPAFRERVQAVNPEAYLVGEIWEEAPDWLRGDRFDALMNYPLAVAILGFVGGPHLDLGVIAGQPNYAKALVALDGTVFGRDLESLMTALPAATIEAQFNLIGSHDTPRARTVMGGDVARLRLATLLQLTLPGAPSIYYGDELAMEGAADPDCRRAYPATAAEAPDGAAEMRDFVKATLRARREHPSLRTGEVRVAAAGDRWVVIERRADGERAIVAVNAGDEPAEIAVSVEGLHAIALRGLEPTAIRDGGESIVLPPVGGAVLVRA